MKGQKIGKRVVVNLTKHFKYFSYCWYEGLVIDKNKVMLKKPLSCEITSKDIKPLPVVLPNYPWSKGDKVLVHQCIDSYWSWWEAHIIEKANDRQWKIKWVGKYNHPDVMNINKELIAPFIS